MPAAVTDWEALWSSSKVARLQPEEFRFMYAWLFGLPDKFYGSFERDSLTIWQRTCAYQLPSWRPDRIDAFLDAAIAAKLYFPYQNRAGTKTFLHVVGICKPGRLPAVSQLEGDPKLPEPPVELFAEWLRVGSDAGPALFPPRELGFLAPAGEKSDAPTHEVGDPYGDLRGRLDRIRLRGRKGKGKGVGLGAGPADIEAPLRAGSLPCSPSPALLAPLVAPAPAARVALPRGEERKKKSMSLSERAEELRRVREGQQ